MILPMPRELLVDCEPPASELRGTTAMLSLSKHSAMSLSCVPVTVLYPQRLLYSKPRLSAHPSLGRVPCAPSTQCCVPRASQHLHEEDAQCMLSDEAWPGWKTQVTSSRPSVEPRDPSLPRDFSVPWATLG